MATPNVIGKPEPVSTIYTPLLLAALFGIAATVHRLGLDEPARYRSSPLIPVEFILLVATVCVAIGFAGYALIALCRCDWRTALHGAISVTGSALLVGGGLWIDAPTLLYLT